MPHQPTVTKNFRNTQSEFGSYLGSCDVSVAPRAVRLSTSSGTQLLLLPKGNSEVPLFFHFLNYPLYVCKPPKIATRQHWTFASLWDHKWDWHLIGVWLTYCVIVVSSVARTTRRTCESQPQQQQHLLIADHAN